MLALFAAIPANRLAANASRNSSTGDDPATCPRPLGDEFGELFAQACVARVLGEDSFEVFALGKSSAALRNSGPPTLVCSGARQNRRAGSAHDASRLRQDVEGPIPRLGSEAWGPPAESGSCSRPHRCYRHRSCLSSRAGRRSRDTTVSTVMIDLPRRTDHRPLWPNLRFTTARSTRFGTAAAC